MDKIVCFGKSYLEHAKELGDAIPEKPVIFLKPGSVLKEVRDAKSVMELTLPQGVGEVHHECEIVLRLRSGGYRMTPKQAEACIGEIGLGLDMTLRDAQAKLKKAGHPWTTAKVFPDAAVVGPWISSTELPHLYDQPFTLRIDGETRQTGLMTDLVMNPGELLAYASESFPLVAGDVIFTGTPKGVGPVKSGQTAELAWGSHSFRVRWA